MTENLKLLVVRGPKTLGNSTCPLSIGLKGIIEKIDEVKTKLSSDGSVSFDFKLSYFNSASAKFILDILLYINQIHSNDIDIKD
jgi:hypothetical protein